MSDELFPAEHVTQLSPRLAWMKRHEIYTQYTVNCGPDPWAAWWGQRNPVEFIERHEDPEVMGYGATEEAAIVDLAIKWDFKLWNEE